MDICANNGIGSEQFLDSIGGARLDQNIIIFTTKGELVNEVVVRTEEEVVQEEAASNIPVSLPVKATIATSKMPQQSAPRNTTQEEAAGVPTSVQAPTFVIPPHLMGRNVDNPAEDMIGSGRKLQKPRLGVRVPYRNLTSQIVTQDEIAQELLERSMKKHPHIDTPEGGDLFFAMKLTQRLANRLSPAGLASTNVNNTNDIETLAGRSNQFQQNSSSTGSNCLHPIYNSSYTLVPESSGIPDERELLAILEGEADPLWMPADNPKPEEEEVKMSLVNKNMSAEAGSSMSQMPVHISPLKLDPEIEKQLALKQLMELPRRTKKKKTVETEAKTGKSPQKNKKKPDQISSQDSENNNRASLNGNKVETDSTAKQKQGRKRKLTEAGDVNAKRQSLTKRKKTEMSHVAASTNNKTEDDKKRKPGRPPKKAPIGLKDQELPATNVNGIASPKRRKIPGTNKLETPRNKSPVPGPSGLCSQASSKILHATSKIEGVSDDEFSESMLLHSKKTGTPPKTYSPKRRFIRPADSVPSTSKQSSVAAMLVKEIGLTLAEVAPNSSKSGLNSNVSSEGVSSTSTSPSKSSTDTSKTGSSSSKHMGNMVSKNTGSSSGDVSSSSSTNTLQSPKKASNVSTNGQASSDKRRRMREIDRLLMDEGAINLLYEVEQGDTKRRSGVENIVISPKRKIRSPLKSVRRQKKDLLLKTRLVKNAVMRLSNITPSPAAAIALRARKQTEARTLQSTAGHNRSGSVQRTRSLDSRESLLSPPPLTPVDPPSPAQTFSFPPRLHLPAEASRIIRRHSSSSTFSSRSTSPNLQHRNSIEGMQSPENAENKPDNYYGKGGGSASVPSSSRSSSDLGDRKRAEARKKGVPIFIRKVDAAQTYKGKKKRDKQAPESVNNAMGTSNVSVNSEKLELKAHLKPQADVNKKTLPVDSKKKVGISQPAPNKKMSSAVKMKLKSQMSKNFQKGFQKGKTIQLKKPVAQNKVKKDAKHVTGIREIPDLSSCLAAAANAFAAEAESHKKVVALRRSSHDSSPSPSQGSKSPTSSQPPPILRKEPKEVPAPLSPNASSYSSLIKTLETESQKQKKRDEEVIKQRSSVRQNAGTYHYKEICLRRYDNLVQIILTPASTKMKNSLNIQVLRELREALSQLKRDEGCRVVLLTSAGSSFCQGIDFHSLIHTNVDKRKPAAQELAQALKEFLKSLALFTKPLVAGVQGAAVGLGVTMLPFFDMVFASDKATFYTPYAKLGQVPEGAAILTLPHMLGNAVTSELLFGCRKLTANEALHFGLVTRILWPDKFQEELIPIVRSMASQSAQSMEATKALLRHSLRTKLEAALDSEVPLLVQHWISNECQTNFRRFLDDEDVGLQRQRMDP